MNARALATAVAVGRVAFGASVLLAPGKVFRLAGTDIDRDVGTLVWMTRAFGIRDIVLGSGALVALADGDEAAAGRWVTLGAVADTGDATAALVWRSELGGSGLLATLGLAVPAAAAGWWSSRRLGG